MGKDYAVEEESAHFIEKYDVSDRTGFLLPEVSGTPCADDLRTDFRGKSNPIFGSGGPGIDGLFSREYFSIEKYLKKEKSAMIPRLFGIVRILVVRTFLGYPVCDGVFSK